MTKNVSPATAKMIAVEEQLFDGTWRVRIKTQTRKFDDEAKARFLAHYAATGRKGESARVAGVVGSTVHDHIGRDQDFAAAVLAAEHEYRDKVIAHVQKLSFEGTVKTTYDRNGNVVSEETVYPIPLIQMEARRVEEGYRDKREVEMNVRGGVLLAPADVKSIDEWEEKFAGETIDVEATEINENN